MTYKLHRDGVITGALNCFCLACDLFLDTQHEAAEHIETSEHEKRMRAVKYCDKFGLEHIRKVSLLFFVRTSELKLMSNYNSNHLFFPVQMGLLL